MHIELLITQRREPSNALVGIRFAAGSEAMVPVQGPTHNAADNGRGLAVADSGSVSYAG